MPPVRGNAFLSRLVHLLRANLQLEAFALRSDDCGVERLIHIRLGHCDVIFEAAGNWLPCCVNDADRGIAIAGIWNYDSESNKVIDLVEAQIPALIQLLPVEARAALGVTVRRNEEDESVERAGRHPAGL